MRRIFGQSDAWEEYKDMQSKKILLKAEDFMTINKTPAAFMTGARFILRSWEH